MLERRDQWLLHTGSHDREALEAAFDRVVAAELRELHDAFPSDLGAEAAFLAELERFPEGRAEDVDGWRRVADLLLTKDGKLRKRGAHPLKARCENLYARLRTQEALIARLARARDLPAPKFEEAQWQAIEAALSVLKLAVAELQLVFRERGRVDFAELAIRASAALGDVDQPEDLAFALGSSIRHLLVDEFQDTSYTQFELIEKLTAGWEPGDGRTLFLVGDPMQSIYRFRQADVGLFLKARREGIGAIALQPLTLQVNFRSRPGIVAWVNRTFASIMLSDDPDSGAVAYSASVAGNQGEDAMVGIHAFIDRKQEADRVVELLRAHQEGSTAVLVRSRTNLVEIVQALKRHRIPFQAIEIDQLGERQVIEDLMALTFALLHAADRVSWLAILRAPWCGLTLEDLHTLASADHRATVWELLHKQPLTLSSDGSARVGRILPVLEQAIADRGRLPLREWIEGVWLRLGGPACVSDETALEDAAAYFDLLEGLAEGSDLADFDWFREQVNALFAQPNSSAGERLQLMTIHKAKGLEFDTVILPGLDAPPRSDDRRLVLWLEHRHELLLAPISAAGEDNDPIYSYLDRIERLKSDQETSRLLYVAATRARRNLHLLGLARIKSDGSVREPESRSFLRLLWKVVAEEFANPIATTQQEDAQSTKIIRRLPANWRIPDAPPPVPWTRLGIERVAREDGTFEWSSDRARYAGAALHAFLQRIAREGLTAWDEAAVRSRRSAYRAVLMNLGVRGADLAWAIDRVQSGLLQT
ncbi:MAG TPA: 3'-5' exonuclease, partial [Tepidisphaeraceae bacterium]|nr:3'-5' exonuclease [Tepidisphaeraceae bacterium]